MAQRVEELTAAFDNNLDMKHLRNVQLAFTDSEKMKHSTTGDRNTTGEVPRTNAIHRATKRAISVSQLRTGYCDSLDLQTDSQSERATLA